MTIDKLIERATARGAKYVALPLGFANPDGTVSQVRYLENSATKARAMLTQFEAGEIVGISAREAIQRRLGISLTDD